MKKIAPIEFSGDNDILVWKYPKSNFEFNTDILVPYTHEAVFVKDGEIVESFSSGKHVLNQKYMDLFDTKANNYVCSLYYINTTIERKVLWGTPTPITVFDSLMQIPVDIGANGSILIKVNNPRKFLGKFVGQNKFVTTSMIEDYFSEQILIQFKNILSKAMIDDKIGFYDISSKLISLSKLLKDSLIDVFDNYGVDVCDAVINGLIIPEETKTEIQKIYIQKAKKDIVGENKTKCEFCGAEIEENSNFCTVCGKSLKEGISIPLQDKFYCQFCGEENPENATFCSACGKKLK